MFITHETHICRDCRKKALCRPFRIHSRQIQPPPKPFQPCLQVILNTSQANPTYHFSLVSRSFRIHPRQIQPTISALSPGHSEYIPGKSNLLLNHPHAHHPHMHTHTHSHVHSEGPQSTSYNSTAPPETSKSAAGQCREAFPKMSESIWPMLRLAVTFLRRTTCWAG